MAKTKTVSKAPDSLRRIRIGTLVNADKAPEHIRALLPYGFESFQLTFWETTGGIDLKKLAKRVKDALGDSGAIVSSLGVFGNPLENRKTADSWKACIDHAGDFGCDIVAGFAGRVVDKPIPDSIPVFKKVFGELAKRAAGRGVRIAFENCSMGGNWHRGGWNIAHHPESWELMFDALPQKNLGLEWEPCHQMVTLIDPIAQLRKWAKKVFHLHGKDATVAWDVVREFGTGGGRAYAWHRTPGFGDTNWTDVISILRMAGFEGSIDIEGWHDPVYNGDLEYVGQVHGLNYLKACRGGGEFVPPIK